MTALVNPSSSIADGALTLIVTPALLAATLPATLKLEGMALPLGTKPPEVALTLMLGAVAIAVTVLGPTEPPVPLPDDPDITQPTNISFITFQSSKVC